MTRLLWLFLALPYIGLGQNLETIGKENPLTVSGGLSLNQIFYGVHGIESRRDPRPDWQRGSCDEEFKFCTTHEKPLGGD